MDNPEYYMCIFMGDHVICMTCVDACLCLEKLQKYIDTIFEKILSRKFELKDEYHSITGFLGLYIANNGTGNDKNINFIMENHIDNILALTRIHDGTPKDNLSIHALLGLDIDGITHK